MTLNTVSNVDFVLFVLPQVLCKSLCFNGASNHFVAACVLETEKSWCVCVEKIVNLEFLVDAIAELIKNYELLIRTT
jgi:hypothetical protein